MRRFFALALVWLVVAAALPARAEPRAFEVRGGQVVITVTLKGQALPALLDTGATRSLIDVGLARELGIRTQRMRNGGTFGAAGSSVQFGWTTPLAVDFGAGATTRSLGTYKSEHAFAPEGVRMLIGMDLLDDLAVSLDFATMMADFQRLSDFKPPEGEPLKLTQSGWHRPTLPVWIAGMEADLLIDTAASSALHLDAAFVAKTPSLSSLPTSRRTVTGIDGVREHDVVVVPCVSFGDHAFANVRASSGPFVMTRWSNNVDGVLGVGLLKHFKAVIDFGYNRLWLTPNTETDSRSCPD